MRILVIPVLYNSPDSGLKFVQQLASTVDGDSVRTVLVDNSPSCDPRLELLTQDYDAVSLRHFPDNPGYMGAAKLVLAELVADEGPLPYTAVVLCNTDLEFDGNELVRVVQKMREKDPSCRWILAPGLVEPDGTRLNPHMVSRPTRLRSSAQISLGLSYPTAVAYRVLSRVRRQRHVQDNSASAGTRMFAPHGSMMIFGAGYFRHGGSLPDGPLFNEESAVGQLAAHTETPVIFTPELMVTHEGQLTTGAHLSRQRYELSRDAWRFYRNWRPSYAAGTMRTWFTDPKTL